MAFTAGPNALAETCSDGRIERFHIDIPEASLTDLRQRLCNARWPERETVDDWSQGVPLDRLRALCDYWANGYDWRTCESRLNSYEQFRTNIDGLGIHFLHVRSPRADALPMILTHGWPGSVIEFLECIGPLTEPDRHGAPDAPAFHVVIPSLPGYGFSDKPASRGWGIEGIATAWAELMQRLGYKSYVAQGGDWGAMVTTALGMARPPGLRAIHINMPMVKPIETDLTPAERAALAGFNDFKTYDSAYSSLQRTRPQTIGYALTDSPVGQAAWIYEKFKTWTDNKGEPEQVLSRDAMLDNITLYWLTGTAASSGRLYWESFGKFKPGRVDLPSGISIFPKEMFRPSRRWAEGWFTNLIHWNELDRGGHFAAFEQPALFVSELRACFARLA